MKRLIDFLCWDLDPLCEVEGDYKMKTLLSFLILINTFAMPVWGADPILLAPQASGSKLTFNWDAHPQAAEISGFRLYRTATMGDYVGVVPVAIPGGTTRTFDLQPVPIGKWFFVLRAVVGALATSTMESASSNEVSATVLPATPTGLTATQAIASRIAVRGVDLAWKSIVPTEDEIHLGPQGAEPKLYKVDFGQPVTDHWFRVGNLLPRTVYNYRIVSKLPESPQIVSEQAGSFITR